MISENIVIVENPIELLRVLKVCKPGDTIELERYEWSRDALLEHDLKTNEITICGRDGSLAVIMLNIYANNCTVKNLHFQALCITGIENTITQSTVRMLDMKGNSNKITDCVFQYGGYRYVTEEMVKISGNNNQLEHCVLNDVVVRILGTDNKLEFASFEGDELSRVVISGSRNIIRSSIFMSIIPKDTIRKVINHEEVEFLKMQGFNIEFGEKWPWPITPLFLILTADSSFCSISEGNLQNVFIAGEQHSFSDVTVHNILAVTGKGHCIKNCKGNKIQDESEGSSVEFLKQDVDVELKLRN